MLTDFILAGAGCPGKNGNYTGVYVTVLRPVSTGEHYIFSLDYLDVLKKKKKNVINVA